MFLTVLILTLFGIGCHGDIIIIDEITNSTVNVFIDFDLTFTSTVPNEGIEGVALAVQPDDACLPITTLPPTHVNGTRKWFAIIKRKTCTLEEKVRNAQIAGFEGAIIYNWKGSDSLRQKTHAPKNPDITIPGVLIGEDDGRRMVEFYQYDKGYYVILNPDSNFNLSSYLLPFVIVISICFLVMFLFMMIKCIKDRRRNRRNRLSSRHLKHLVVKKFKTGDQYEVCAICLEEYVVGEKLRILPCAHAYHTKCIDPWLTNNRRNCPICKRRVAIEGVTFDSDSESETENERTPLLANNDANDAAFRREVVSSLFAEPSSAASGSSYGSIAPSSVHSINYEGTPETDNAPRVIVSTSATNESSPRRSRDLAQIM